MSGNQSFIDDSTRQMPMPQERPHGPERRWVWISTPESIWEQKLSILALLETILAMSIFVGIALYFHTLKYLAVSACMAPFLLLRTPTSMKLGWHLFRRAIDYILDLDSSEKSKVFMSVIKVILFIPVFSISAVLCKVGATMLCVLRRPFESLAAIPNNWFLISMCTDMHRMPELLPGTDLIPKHEALHFDEMFKDINLKKDGDHWSLKLILAPALILFGFGPALLYRWSLKGTSLVWMPLLWAVNPAVSASGGTFKPRDQLDDIRHGVSFKLALTLSTMTLFLGVFKILLFSAWNKWQSWWVASLPDILDRLVAPLSVYPWHLTALGNSLLAWGLFIWADENVRHPERTTDERVQRFLQKMFTVRRFLTLYTSLNGLAILVSVAGLLRHLKIQWRWFSWWP